MLDEWRLDRGRLNGERMGRWRLDGRLNGGRLDKGRLDGWLKDRSRLGGSLNRLNRLVESISGVVGGVMDAILGCMMAIREMRRVELLWLRSSEERWLLMSRLG